MGKKVVDLFQHLCAGNWLIFGHKKTDKKYTELFFSNHRARQIMHEGGQNDIEVGVRMAIRVNKSISNAALAVATT